MPPDDLASIPGLQDKHRRVLAERLDVTSYQDLADTDPQAIHHAMRRLRPPPTQDAVVAWQEEARARLARVPATTSGWDRTASFVVTFEQRPGDGGIERRLAIEQTEIEPEQPPMVWTGWDCRSVCGWMRDRMGLPGDEPVGEPPVARVTRAETPPQAAAAGPSEGAGEHTGRRMGRDAAPGSALLRIDRVTAIDETGRLDVVADDQVITPAGAGCASPGRLSISLTASHRDREVHVALRLRRYRTPGHDIPEPVAMRGGGQVELDLSRVPPGHYDLVVLAWTPDGSANPHVVEVPGFTVGLATANHPAARPP